MSKASGCLVLAFAAVGGLAYLTSNADERRASNVETDQRSIAAAQQKIATAQKQIADLSAPFNRLSPAQVRYEYSPTLAYCENYGQSQSAYLNSGTGASKSFQQNVGIGMADDCIKEHMAQPVAVMRAALIKDATLLPQRDLEDGRKELARAQADLVDDKAAIERAAKP